MDSIALAAYKMAKNGVPGPAGKDGKNGQDGNNGLTPYIGENGNWFIGDTDTGVKAEASDGINITITDIVESTEDGGDNVVTFSNGQKLIVKNGKTGGKGEKGDPYVLNTTDKEAIVEDVKKEFTNVYKYSGSVATFSDLPEGLLEGDAGVVYNVEDDGMNYAWTGERWDPLGLTLDNISYNNLKDTPASKRYALEEYDLTPHLQNGESGWIIIKEIEGISDTLILGSKILINYNRMGFNTKFSGVGQYLGKETVIDCSEYGIIRVRIRTDSIMSSEGLNDFTYLETNLDEVEYDAIKDSITIAIYDINYLNNDFISEDTWNQVQQMIDTSISEYDAEVSALIGEVEE